MDGLAVTKPKHSKQIQWIDIFNRHDGLTIHFPDGEIHKVETKAEVKTLIRHWVREQGGHGVKVIWPKSHQEMWAVDL